MSLEKIIKEAIDKNPMEMKDAFAEEMQRRIQDALEEKANLSRAGFNLIESAEAIANHSKVISDHVDRNGGKDGDHGGNHPDHLAKLRHAHKSLANIHDAHRTVHTHAGNHDEADDHKVAAEGHREAADMSRPNSTYREKNSHEEYSSHAGMVGHDSSTAFKHKLPKH